FGFIIPNTPYFSHTLFTIKPTKIKKILIKSFTFYKDFLFYYFNFNLKTSFQVEILLAET
ncbi:hypothetical protein GW891_04340, partial [bacterium]|nr:hypothetical protein [bacterium]